MRLRPLSRTDLDTVRRLRNANRQWFFDSREVSAADQAKWFDGLSDRPVEFFVIEDDDRVVGTISLSARGDEVEVGNLILDPAARGRGLMRQAVSLLSSKPGVYFAEVKSDNESSLRVFRACGFEESSADEVILFIKRVAG